MRSRRAFTLVEFMVLLGIGLILLSIFIPYLLRLREDNRRALCANNLKQIGEALARYARENGNHYPRVVYDEVTMPTGYRAFTGADDDNPFAPNSAVQPNDVTASLWLLVRHGLNPAVFVCPGSDDSRDLMTDAAGRFVNPSQRGNFRRPSNLSYSYASPYSSALNFRLNSDWVNFEFALVADKNPGVDATSDVTRPSADADPVAQSQANSLHHGRAGQNVLYPNLHVAFHRTPYAGTFYSKAQEERRPPGDNIYTARMTRPATQSVEIPVYVNGFCGRNLSPATPDDSYLVPTAQDGPSSPPPPLSATQPAAVTATAPATATAPTAPGTVSATAPAPATAPVPATTSATTQP